MGLPRFVSSQQEPNQSLHVVCDAPRLRVSASAAPTASSSRPKGSGSSHAARPWTSHTEAAAADGGILAQTRSDFEEREGGRTDRRQLGWVRKLVVVVRQPRKNWVGLGLSGFKPEVVDPRKSVGFPVMGGLGRLGRLASHAQDQLPGCFVR